MNFPADKQKYFRANQLSILCKWWVLAALFTWTTCSVVAADNNIEHTLPLEAGWNLVALPAVPQDPDLQGLLAPLEDKVISAWSFDALSGSWRGYNPAIPELSDLNFLVPGVGYWIQMNESAEWVLSGSPTQNASESAEGLQLKIGWNLVGYSSSLAQDISVALASIEASLEAAYAYDSARGAWKVYDPTRPADTEIDQLQLAQGIWLLVSEACVWQAPNVQDRLIDQETGEALVGAIVSLDGIEAEAVSNESGEFEIFGVSSASDQLLTVNAEGYTPIYRLVRPTEQGTLVSATSGSRSAKLSGDGLVLSPLPAPKVSDVLSPVDGAHYQAPTECDTVVMPVRGYASLEDVGTLRLDIALVIDTSGSTKKTTDFDQNKDNSKDTVLEAEVHACRKLVDSLRPDNTRFSVIKFARLHKKNAALGEISDGPILEKQTRIVQDMTKDRAAIHTALDKILEEGSLGGSDTGGGISTGVSALENAPPVSDTAGYSHSPLRHIIIVTDGIPTLPIESGYTQERGDREAALTAAQQAALAGVAIHPIVIEPVNASDRRFTTMPAVQAITGVSDSPRWVNLDTIDQLDEMLAGLSLTGITGANLLHVNTGTVYPLLVQPDGYFESIVLLGIGHHEFEFEIFTSNRKKATKYTVACTVHAASGVIGTAEIVADQTTVKKLKHLVRPTGGKVKGNLHKSLKQRYPNATVLSGVEGWRALDSTMTLEFTFKEAAWRSDVGYFVFDPANPPATGSEILANLGPDNVLVHTGDYPNGWFSPGSGLRTIDVPSDVAVGFFMIPNGTLAQAQAGHSKEPLFTMQHLNPGLYDQVLTFWDPDKQQVLFAYEDITILGNRSDQDFQDIMFTIEGGDSIAPILECAP